MADPACACAWYQVLIEDVRRAVLSLLDCVSRQAFCLTSKTEMAHLPAQDSLDYYDQLALLMKSGLCSGAFLAHMVRTHATFQLWKTLAPHDLAHDLLPRMKEECIDLAWDWCIKRPRATVDSPEFARFGNLTALHLLRLHPTSPSSYMESNGTRRSVTGQTMRGTYYRHHANPYMHHSPAALRFRHVFKVRALDDPDEGGEEESGSDSSVSL